MRNTRGNLKVVFLVFGLCSVGREVGVLKNLVTIFGRTAHRLKHIG